MKLFLLSGSFNIAGVETVGVFKSWRVTKSAIIENKRNADAQS